uniref:Flagellar alpha dynein n=1 Tax=Tetraselmis sp. GSL018 TaxID=582737 RepID=A0A061RCW1_9CHLO
MLADANQKLEEVQTRVAELNAMVADLEQQFAEATKEKEDAIAEKERCERKLNLANRLITALASEGERWAITVDQLKADYEVLTGDMLFSAAFVSYAGPFTSNFRADMIKVWLDFMQEKGVTMTEGLTDPLKLLADDAQVAGWVREGLPSDPTSVQNGTILMNTERWPLMLDPQLQGIVWIKERESKNNLVVLRMGTPTMVTSMERAMEAGHSVLIENMDETIDAVINPVVTRSTFKKGRAYYVKLGDKEVEFHKNFKLFMHTKLSNPHYGPEIQAETTLINFTVTEQGLEDQLLALVVNKERPDLEETKTHLIIQNTEFTIKLKELEDGLLNKLSTAEGDLTEDVALIESLEESKRVADEITEKVEAAKETEVTINENRNKYRSVAHRGAMLFFLLNSLNKIHAFYQFSLNAFVVVFSRGIDLAEGGPKKKGDTLSLRTLSRRLSRDSKGESVENGVSAEQSTEKVIASQRSTAAGDEDEEEEEEDEQVSAEELEKRLILLINSCTYTVYDYTRRGLFDRDKLIFSSLLTFQLQLRSNEIDAQEYDTLCKGIKTPNPPPITDDLSRWMNEAQWSALTPLTALPVFASLPKDMEKNSDEWQAWNAIDQVERSKMPGEWGKMSLFRQLLIIRAMRPDRVSSALEIYVEKSMGPQYTNQEAFSMASMMAESSQQTPIFFVLFPGYSPSKEFEAYANQHEHTAEDGTLTIISMGQGQEAPAEAILDKYTEEGGWVFLDNVHLMQGWIPNLERKLEIAQETAHPDFRCLFSAEPINGAPFARIVPESILQTCIKISNEPPSDMKSNMRRALAGFSQEVMDRPSTEEKRKAFTCIMFGLCFYHSLLLGRKKFGTGIGNGSGSGLGFCRGYSFNMGDLTTCGDVLYNYIEGNNNVPWADLRYMFGEVFYGGHITDAMDRRCCTTYLDVMIIPDILPKEDEPPSLMLAPGFKAPMPGDYEYLKDYINTSLPPESPIVYGMHPNAELSLLTQQGEQLFRTVIEVSGGGDGAGAAGGTSSNIRTTLEQYLDNLPQELNLVEIEARVKDKTPYVVVALQETGRMNNLLSEMRRSMEELTLGLDGALNMSDKMEALAKGLNTNSVPALWMSMMSTRIQEVYSLTAWYQDVIKRYDQLAHWTAGDIVMPNSVWLPGLFNPKAFLTAVMQVYARANNLPLDVMKFMTEVSPKTSVEQVSEPAPLGVYIHGLFMEGARWDREEGTVADSLPGELHPPMPVIQVVPVTSEDFTLDGYYHCPVYTNMQRANVYSAIVAMFTLKTSDPSYKWVLASVALLLQDELS